MKHILPPPAGRIPKEDKGFLETGERLSSLRPSTAYLMLRMAEPTVGDVIVDRSVVSSSGTL